MRPRKVDTTHVEIKAVLLANGWLPIDIHALPKLCDIVAIKMLNGTIASAMLIECKTGKGKMKGGNLIFEAICESFKIPLYVVRSGEAMQMLLNGDYNEPNE
jgi:hypothetical protein